MAGPPGPTQVPETRESWPQSTAIQCQSATGKTVGIRGMTFPRLLLGKSRDIEEERDRTDAMSLNDAGR